MAPRAAVNRRPLLGATLCSLVLGLLLGSVPFGHSPGATIGRPTPFPYALGVEDPEPGCALESNLSLDQLTAGSYEQAVGHGLNPSQLPQSRANTSMDSAFRIVCATPEFSAALSTGGPTNFSVGFEFNVRNSTGTGYFTESWATADALVQETWSVDLLSGGWSGPTVYRGPLICECPGLPTPPTGVGTETPLLWLALAVAFGGSVGAVAYLRGRGRP